MTTTISNRTEFDAALKRQAELQRSAGNDPEKQRELRELTEKVEAYRRANPAEGRAPGAGERSGRTSQDASTGPDLSGQNVHDPHNENNVGRGINDPNRNSDANRDQATPSDPNRAAPLATPAGGATPGAPGATPGTTPSTPGTGGSGGNR